MGRVKPTYIKRTGNLLLENYSHLLTSDFEQNKRLMAEVFKISKNHRNRLAGYVTRAMKREEE